MRKGVHVHKMILLFKTKYESKTSLLIGVGRYDILANHVGLKVSTFSPPVPNR